MMRSHPAVSRPLLFLAALLLGAGGAFAARPPDGAGAAIAATIRDVRFAGDLGVVGDLTFNGIIDRNEITFGVPGYWQLDAEPELHLRLARSSDLLPDVSSITVLLDGRPVATIKLNGAPEVAWEKAVKLPLGPSATGYHSLKFKAYHRSHLPCELADHPGLWSRVLGDSFVRVRYHAVAPELSLSKWPYPFRDDRDPDARTVVLVLPDKPTADEIKVAGYLSSTLAFVARWRPLDLVVHQGTIATAPRGNLIVLGRGDAPDSLAEVAALLDGAGDEQKAAAAIARGGAPWPGAGVLALARRPGSPDDSVLALLGKDGKGLVELALLLSGREGQTLPVGVVQRVDDVKAGPAMEPRRWTATVPPEVNFTLQEIGLHDLTVLGWHGGTVRIPLRIVPDERPIAGKVHFELVYSYAAQVDPERSRIDVSLNDADVGGTALGELNGKNRATLSLELPAHEIGPDSELAVSFSLVPRTKPVCIGEYDSMVWGTVHSDSSVSMPRDRWSAGPELGLLRFGGFPFGLAPDYATTRIVLPREPSRTELQMYAWFAAELGRVARGDRFAYQVSLGSDDAIKSGGEDLIVIDSGPEGRLLEDVGLLYKMSFAPKDGHGLKVAFASGGAVALGASPTTAYIEELVVPGPPRDRTAVVAYAVEPELFTRVGQCVAGGSLLENLHGRVARIASCADIASIATVDRKILGRKPITQAAYEPIRNNYWTLFAGIVGGIVVTLLLLGLWSRLRERTRPADPAAKA